MRPAPRLILTALLGTTFCLAIDPRPVVSAEPPGIAVGDNAPDFELPVVGGDGFLRLSDEIRKGPVVVVVLRGYPGYQCGICNRQVGSMVSRARALGDAAGRVILVYPGDDDRLDRHAEAFLGSRRIPQPLVMVRDEGMEMVTEWGLRWDRPNETAYPATFVIDRDGRVRWKKVSDSHAGRSRVEEILKAIRAG